MRGIGCSRRRGRLGDSLDLISKGAQRPPPPKPLLDSGSAAVTMSWCMARPRRGAPTQPGRGTPKAQRTALEPQCIVGMCSCRVAVRVPACGPIRGVNPDETVVMVEARPAARHRCIRRCWSPAFPRGAPPRSARPGLICRAIAGHGSAARAFARSDAACFLPQRAHRLRSTPSRVCWILQKCTTP